MLYVRIGGHYGGVRRLYNWFLVVLAIIFADLGPLVLAGGVAGGVAGLLAAERLQHAQPQQQQQQPRHGAALQHCSHHITISAESHCSPGHRSLLPAVAS